MELKFKKLFQKNAKKLVQGNEKLQEKINHAIIDFATHLFDSQFYRKPLRGVGKDIHELQIGGDIRIIIEVILIHDTIIFLNI